MTMNLCVRDNSVKGEERKRQTKTRFGDESLVITVIVVTKEHQFR